MATNEDPNLPIIDMIKAKSDEQGFAKKVNRILFDFNFVT